MALSWAEIKAKLQAIDVSAVQGRGLRRKFEQIRRKKEGGFTLLELLVVVAILAAIAGTATIMLQDTDRKASAGAHVAMMDEMTKAIHTFRTINGSFPNNWDSLYESTAVTALATRKPIPILSEDLVEAWSAAGYAGASIEEGTVIADDVAALKKVGVEHVRVASTTACRSTTGTTDRDHVQAYINEKDNDVTAQNYFRGQGVDGNGCSFAASATLVGGDPAMVWVSTENRRVNAYISGDVLPDGNTATADDKLVAFGIGPNATLFDPAYIGALSNTPVYRHVEPDEYNRFIVLFKVSGYGTDGVAVFQAIVDGAGDTKDEELGELDNVRAT